MAADNIDIRFGYRTYASGDLALTVFLPDLFARSPAHVQQWVTYHKELFVEELGWDILNEHLLTIPIKGATYVLRSQVEKRGVKVFVGDPDAECHIPADGMLRKIEREVTLSAHEHFIIYVDVARENQVWQWVKREEGKRLAPRMHRYHQWQSGELLAIGLEEEARLHMAEVAGRMARAFDVERVTRKLYDHFKLEYAAFLQN